MSILNVLLQREFLKTQSKLIRQIHLGFNVISYCELINYQDLYRENMFKAISKNQKRTLSHIRALSFLDWSAIVYLNKLLINNFTKDRNKEAIICLRLAKKVSSDQTELLNIPLRPLRVILSFME
jgi:hypothetical protein